MTQITGLPCYLGMPFCGNVFFPHGATATTEPGPPHYQGFTITMGRIPLE
jgi:hypothetical protein